MEYQIRFLKQNYFFEIILFWKCSVKQKIHLQKDSFATATICADASRRKISWSSSLTRDGFLVIEIGCRTYATTDAFHITDAKRQNMKRLFRACLRNYSVLSAYKADCGVFESAKRRSPTVSRGLVPNEFRKKY